jgi:hypothetical protein
MYSQVSEFDHHHFWSRRADMSRMQFTLSVLGLSLLGSCLALAQNPPQAPAQPQPMTFFITSSGPGKGGNLGGLAGADAHCQKLATEVGAGNRTWRAYLSTQGANAVNAKQRIGRGPWHNARGQLVGENIEEIHSMNHRFNAQTILDERGRLIPGGGYTPNRHDVLTGSKPDGTAFPAGEDMTCNNWTSSSTGKARIGHHDRAAWNSAHDTRGCSQEQLISTGGDGLFYCFAVP